MAGPMSEDGEVTSSRSKISFATGRPSSSGRESLIPPKGDVIQRWNHPVIIILGLLLIVGTGAIVGFYLASHPKETIPIGENSVPAATSPWKPIAERMQQAERGQFPIDDGILTVSASVDASDSEIRSVIGTFELPRYGAAQIESGESWGVTGTNRDQLVMYVRNFLDVPVTAMLLRISEGSCASFGPQSRTVWASAYWADALRAGKAAVFRATLPEPYGLPSYCAVVLRIYSSRVP